MLKEQGMALGKGSLLLSCVVMKRTMGQYKIIFDSLEWSQPAQGARFKAFCDGEHQIRLVEFTSELVEPDWCETGHIGYIVEGELEVDFHGIIVRYPVGSGIFIPKGVKHGHKARS